MSVVVAVHPDGQGIQGILVIHLFAWLGSCPHTRDTPEGLPEPQALSCPQSLSRTGAPQHSVTGEATGPGELWMQTWDGFVNLACAEPLQPLYSLSTVCAASLAGGMPAMRDPSRALEMIHRLVQLSLQHFSQQSRIAVTWKAAHAAYPYLSSVLTNIIRLN